MAGDIEVRTATSLGAPFGCGLLLCAAGEVAAFVSPPFVIRGGFFTTDTSGGAGPLHLAFAVVLGALGLAALLRRDVPVRVTFALVPSLAVAAAWGGYIFYIAIRSAETAGNGSFHETATVGAWGELVVALVGGAVVVFAVGRMRGRLVFRRDTVVTAVGVACAALLTAALLSDRFRIGSARTGVRIGALFDARNLPHTLDLVVIVGYSIIVLAAVPGGALLAAALGRSRSAALLLIGVAFGAVLNDSFWLNSADSRFFSLLAPFWVLVAVAGVAVALASWCWVGER